MHPIDPGIEWGESLVIGGSQTDTYEPLYARHNPDGHTVTRWRLTNKDREALVSGGDIYLAVLQFGNPFQPVTLWVEGMADP